MAWSPSKSLVDQVPHALAGPQTGVIAEPLRSEPAPFHRCKIASLITLRVLDQEFGFGLMNVITLVRSQQVPILRLKAGFVSRSFGETGVRRFHRKVVVMLMARSDPILCLVVIGH